MAVQAGEENVATLYGDVHYFYGSPDDKPRHHRFDKGSFVYLFENANEGRARIEVANQPGSDDQDAFDGYLDHTHLRYSYKQTCVVTLEVGELDNQEEWHLPTFDPHNKNKYHYPLHSLDIYFWTQADALQFVNGIRRVLPPAQCEILDEPGPPARQSADVSSVVQKLEQAAISQPAAAAGLPAPPPLSAVSAGGSPPPQAFVPMAYNPAAPAAPEAVRPREKTPPPPDGGVNPLQQTLATDASTPFSPGLIPPHGLGGLGSPGPLSPGVPPPQYHSIVAAGSPVFAAPPQHSVTSPGLPPQGFGHTHPGLTRAVTVPITPGMSSPYGVAGFGQQVQPLAGPTVMAGPPMHHTPTPPTSGGGLPGPPPGGYSQYSYTSPSAATPLAGADQYAMHNQLYRPTEAEMNSHGHGHGHGGSYQGKKETRGKLEENAGRLERGVSGLLKKFESKFG